jgi:hypothetical protein
MWIYMPTPPYALNGVVLNWLSTGPTLPFLPFTIIWLCGTHNQSCGPLTTVWMHVQLASVKLSEFTITQQLPTS